MFVESNLMRLPAYQSFSDTVVVLNLPLSCSALHGVICGFLCASEPEEGEHYLSSFMVDAKDAGIKAAVLALFDMFTISQQQINHVDLSFELFLPGDHAPLPERAQAFSEWCSGFIEGMTMAGIEVEDLEEEESQDAMQHLKEFSELDYQDLTIEEDDERALLEVSEYARMTVLRLYMELQPKEQGGTNDRLH